MEEKKLQIELAQLFEDEGVKFRENSSNQLIMDQCYNCGRSKKLYVNKDTGVYVCFRCNEKGNGVKLVAKYLDISFKEASKMLYGVAGKINASLKAVQEEEDEPLLLNLGGLTKKKTGDLGLPPPLELAPELTQLKPEHTIPYNYLIKRGYTPEDIEDLKLLILPFATFGDAWKAVENRLKKTTNLTGEALKNEVKNVVRIHERIMFPVYVDYNIVGYVARDYTGKKEPKVLNSSGNFRSFSVWNFDNARDSKKLIICEGTTSAVKCRINRSIALLGKVATPGQIRLIKKTKAQEVYLCLDIGTDKEVLNIYKSLSTSFPGKVYIINLPPVVDLKIKLLDGLVSKVNSIFEVEWKHLSETKQVYLLPSEKIAILDALKISNKLPSDEKRSLFHKRIKSFTQFSDEESAQIAWVLFESEYKDSGDYSHAEMDEFINQAVPYKDSGLQLN